MMRWQGPARGSSPEETTARAVVGDQDRRRRRAVGQADEIAGGLICLLAISLAGAGLFSGMSVAYSETWLFAGMIAALAATAFMFGGDRRGAVAEICDGADTEPSEARRRPRAG